MRVRTFSVLSTAALALMFATLARDARADVIFSNFGGGQTYNGSGWWDVGGVPSAPSQVDAFSFSPSTTSVVTGADLALAGSAPPQNPVTPISPLTVYIESNTGAGQPGTILDTLTQSGGTYSTYPTTTVVNFTCSGVCTTLDAGTTYWIVGQQPVAGDLAYWLLSLGDSGTWYFNDANSSTGPWTVATATGNVGAFDVTGTPSTVVPEPASLALLGCGLVGIVAASRRRAWRR